MDMSGIARLSAMPFNPKMTASIPAAACALRGEGRAAR